MLFQIENPLEIGATFPKRQVRKLTVTVEGDVAKAIL